MSRVPRAPKEVDTVLHQGRATKWTCVLVCVLLLSVSGTTLTYPEGTYSYSDDFETNKAIADSYLHSPFVASLPPVYLEGILMYSYASPGNRVLGFYKGFEVEAEAYLYYRLPVGGGSIDSTCGRLEFDLGLLPGYSKYMAVSVSYDPGPGGFTVAISSPGHYEYDFTPPQTSGGVYVRFNGCAVFLDNLSLVFSPTTSVEETTWGRIKALLR